jgi:hypothetical protein
MHPMHIRQCQAAVDVLVIDVASICERLARRGQFLEDRGLAEWPDGTVSGRYGFRHALYQEVIYRCLGGGRQTRMHRLVGERMVQAYGARAHEVAAELTMHFERGRDYQRAVQYLGQAAENATQRSVRIPREGWFMATLDTGGEFSISLCRPPVATAAMASDACGHVVHRRASGQPAPHASPQRSGPAAHASWLNP